MIVLVDSDIVIEVMRGRNQQVLMSWETLAASDGRILYTPVTAAEVWHGAWPSETARLQQFFASITCVNLDENIGRVAGSFLRQFSKSHRLQLGDALIAATTVVTRSTLWTRNKKHYPMKEVNFFSAS